MRKSQYINGRFTNATACNQALTDSNRYERMSDCHEQASGVQWFQ